LMKYLSAEEGYLVLSCLAQNDKFKQFTKYDASLYSHALYNLLQTYYPLIHQQISALAHTSFADMYLKRMFTEACPPEMVMRIFDCFLFEGPKVIFKMGLHLIHTNYELSSQEGYTSYSYFKTNPNVNFELAMELKLPSVNVTDELEKIVQSTFPNFTDLSEILDRG